MNAFELTREDLDALPAEVLAELRQPRPSKPISDPSSYMRGYRAGLKARATKQKKILRRMPDVAMVEAGRKAMEPEKFVSHCRALWVWNAMWDAAPKIATPDQDYGAERSNV